MYGTTAVTQRSTQHTQGTRNTSVPLHIHSRRGISAIQRETPSSKRPQATYLGPRAGAAAPDLASRAAAAAAATRGASCPRPLLLLTPLLLLPQLKRAVRDVLHVLEEGPHEGGHGGVGEADAVRPRRQAAPVACAHSNSNQSECCEGGGMLVRAHVADGPT